MEPHYKSVKFIERTKSLHRMHTTRMNICARICSAISHVSTRHDVEKRLLRVMERQKVRVVPCYDISIGLVIGFIVKKSNTKNPRFLLVPTSAMYITKATYVTVTGFITLRGSAHKF